MLMLVGFSAYWVLSEDDKPAIEVSAIQLYNDYKKNESMANHKYLDNKLLLTGVVHKVLKQSPYSVLVDGGGGYIQVEFRDKTKSLASGDTVLVLARCTGYLMDVNLTDAKLITR